MAKSKITYEWSDDGTGRTCLKVKRKGGKLTWADVKKTGVNDGYCGACGQELVWKEMEI